MELAKVRVQGYRCLEDVTVDFGDLTVLLGGNSTGKSSLLKALKFFFEPEPLDPADVFGESGRVVVEVTFTNLNEADRDAFTKYAQGLQMVLRKTWVEGEVKMTGLGLAYPGFDCVKEADGAVARRKAFNTVRQAGHPELPGVTKVDDIAQAMLTWEMEHPERCEEREQDASNLFGLRSVAQSLLAHRFKFVFVPGLRDAAAEATERRGTLLEQLLTAIAEQRAQADSELAELEQSTLERYAEVISRSHGPTLSGLAENLSTQMRRYVPNAAIRLEPEAPRLNIGSPTVVLRGGEERHLTDLGRQGHGFQRTFIIAALEYLAGTASQESTEVASRPTLFLAIEEPELYQHPPRARHFGATLSKLASDDAVQVCYATHSPYFVTAEEFGSIRLFRRTDDGGRREVPPHTTVVQGDAENVASRLDGITEARLKRKIARTMSESFREGFFARAVVLVEGDTDIAALTEAAQLLGVDLLAKGVAFVPTSKTGLPIGRAILDSLDIPCYVVFDGDAQAEDRIGCDECGRGGSTDRTSAIESNRRLLLALGEQPEDFPATGCRDRWACFEYNLEHVLEAIPAFVTTAEAVAQEMGWKRKSPEVYAETLHRLGSDCIPEVIKQIIARVNALAS